MSHPPSPTHHDSATDNASKVWLPGIWLLHRAGSWGRALLLLTMAMLPVLAWLEPAVGPASLPRVAALPLLLAASYFWICAHLVARPRQQVRQAAPTAASGGIASDAPAAETVGGDASNALSIAPPSVAIGEAVDELPVHEPGETVAPPPPAIVAPQPDEQAPGGEPGLSPGLHVDHARIQMAVDEIARRVMGSSGLLDSCATTSQAALADLEALQDEERHAQKVLVALRARLMALNQRNHALVQAALATPASQEDRTAMPKFAQAAQAQVLHSHQLAERLSATERSHGMRMTALQRNLEVVAAHAERGLIEAQQLMHLTRCITDALLSAGRRLDPTGMGADQARG